MCLNIQSLVDSETRSFENFSIKENNFIRWHFVRKFDRGVEWIGEINEVADFFFGQSPHWKNSSRW